VEVEEGLDLDGTALESSQPPIGEAFQASLLVSPGSAEANFAWSDQAPTLAERALN
jgi:hypothetical protein